MFERKRARYQEKKNLEIRVIFDNKGHQRAIQPNLQQNDQMQVIQGASAAESFVSFFH